jgi:hypothetical protein
MQCDLMHCQQSARKMRWFDGLFSRRPGVFGMIGFEKTRAPKKRAGNRIFLKYGC